MNGIYEQVVAWTFILLRLLIFAGLVSPLEQEERCR